MLFIVLAVALASCASGSGMEGTTTLIDGASGLDNFNRVGQANWQASDSSEVAAQNHVTTLVGTAGKRLDSSE